jgi:hypothetical protein
VDETLNNFPKKNYAFNLDFLNWKEDQVNLEGAFQHFFFKNEVEQSLDIFEDDYSNG